jgi:hypothetical protein
LNSTPTKRPNKPSQQPVQGKYDHFYAAGTWTNSPAPSALPIPAFKRETGTPKPSPDGASTLSESLSPDWVDRRPGPRPDEHANPFLSTAATLVSTPNNLPHHHAGNGHGQGIFAMDLEPRLALAHKQDSEAERAEKGRKLMSLLQSSAPVPPPVSAPTPVTGSPVSAGTRHPLVEIWEREAGAASPKPQQPQQLGPVMVPLQTRDAQLEEASGLLKNMLRIG